MQTLRLLALLLFVSVAFTQEDPEPEEEAVDTNRCTCREGNSSYGSLGSPKKPPADPTLCPVANRGLTCKLFKPPNKPGYKAANMKSFLLRHSAAWNIQCSMCAPMGKKKIRDEHAEAVTVAASQKKIGGKRIEVAMSPHYVLVMGEHPFLKIRTEGGGVRVADRHELLHLFLQRAEQAREEWAQTFGHPREMRSLIVLVKSESTRQAFSKVHWGNAKTNLLYGGGRGDKPGGAGNGFILSGRSDDDLNFNCRHMIGHLCISTYHSVGVHAKHLPQWIFRGSAHWLCKTHPRARDHAYFCSHEGIEVSGSGSKWEDKARKIAARGPQRDPVERMFQAATAKQMNYQMHVRAWSWFDVFCAEEKDKFVTFVQLLRDAQEARVAAKTAFGQAPEFVDDRWRERVMGKRRDVTASKRESKDKDVEAAKSRELRNIANETDLQLLAGKIRGLERAQNIKTARLLISMLDSKRSERVREVIPLVLSRTTDEKVLEYMRTEGFERAGTYGRATLCRVFGETKHMPALALVRKTLADDPNWLVKANAARALAQLGDKESIKPIALLAGKSGNAKVRMAAMDALAVFGGAAKGTTAQFERNLMHTRWQVKVATCDAFSAIGDTACMEMLIGRLDSEGGRVSDAIRTALEDLTGLDNEWNGQQWLKWWNHTKKFSDRDRKMKEELEKQKKEAERRRKVDAGRKTVAGPKKGGPPTYYGIKVYARAVGYVLDTSLSMEQGFIVSEGWQRRLGRKYTATTRMGVCKEELVQSIEDLDPRTRINIVFFNDRVRRWKNTPVPAAGAADAAKSAVRSVQPRGQTNYYGALRAILGLDDDQVGFRPGFPDTPDTLFFLTDGSPTDGEITKADELLAWFNERNRFARLRVHVIAMGNTGVDTEFLSKLATTNKGTFVHMTGRH